MTSPTIGTYLKPQRSSFTLEQRTNTNSPSQIWTNWSANNYAPAYTQTRIWDIITDPFSQSLNSCSPKIVFRLQNRVVRSSEDSNPICGTESYDDLNSKCPTTIQTTLILLTKFDRPLSSYYTAPRRQLSRIVATHHSPRL